MRDSWQVWHLFVDSCYFLDPLTPATDSFSAQTRKSVMDASLGTTYEARWTPAVLSDLCPT